MTEAVQGFLCGFLAEHWLPMVSNLEDSDG